MRRLNLTGKFFEAPRWRQGRWWVSDMTGRTVHSLSAEGEARLELSLDDRPSGLGWLADGSLIVVGMDSRVLFRRQEGADVASVYADLSRLCEGAEGHLNDMVVSDDGHAYVGFDPDFDLYGFQSDRGAILHVAPDGRTEIAARGLHFPNGMVISEGGSALIVAETGSPRLTRFTIDAAGGLGDSTLWAAVDPGFDRRAAPAHPLPPAPFGLDGCDLDSEGCVWVANANSFCSVRVNTAGEILDAVFIPSNYRCLACGLGGPDGKTLLLCGLDLGQGQGLETSTSHLFAVEVDVAASHGRARAPRGSKTPPGPPVRPRTGRASTIS